MGVKLLVQLILISASLVIVFAFIQPSFRDIKGIQDELFQYKEAVSKAEQFNARLRELISIRDGVDRDDMDTLDRFVPTEIDAVQVMKEIEIIFNSLNVPILSLTAKEEISPISNIVFEGEERAELQESATNYRDFEVTFNGTYEQLKDILLLVEANAVLLEVMNLQFQSVADGTVPEEGGNEAQINNDGFGYLLTLRAFGLTSSQ